MTQVAVVPSNRQVNIVGPDIVAVVHNTSDREITIASHDDLENHLLLPGTSETIHGPCGAIAIGGDASVVVDENAVPPFSTLAEASPQAAVQARIEELERDRAALQRDRDEFERRRQEVTDLEARASDARAAIEWARQESAQPDPPARKPNRKARTTQSKSKKAVTATTKTRSR